MSFPDNLLFYATYDSSLTADYSKAGNPGPDSGGGSRVVDTSVKNCGAGSVKFTSTGWAIYRNQTPLTQQGTVAFWLYASSTANGTFFEMYTYPDNEDLFNFNYFLGGATKIQATVWDGEFNEIGYCTASPTIHNAWVHIEVNYDASVPIVRLFVNGILRDTDSGVSTTMNPDGDDTEIIPRGAGGSGRTSWIDDLQVYNAVIHTANFSPACGYYISGPTTHPYLSFGPRNLLSRGFAR